MPRHISLPLCETAGAQGAELGECRICMAQSLHVGNGAGVHCLALFHVGHVVQNHKTLAQALTVGRPLAGAIDD